MHILHINSITEILLSHLVAQTERYGLSASDVTAICMASSLHDIGKVQVPPEILNKPGRLTDEEFELMKGHALAGAEMVEKVSCPGEEKLLAFAYQICRWHHERWNGSGYPDGLAGDDIPIAAQVVGLACAYESITGEGARKHAYSHDMAMDMIMNGGAGSFNPLLLECLLLADHEVEEAVRVNSLDETRISAKGANRILEEIRQYDNPHAMHAYSLLEDERAKCRFLESLLGGIFFEYDATAKTLTLAEQSAHTLGLPPFIANPEDNDHIAARGLLPYIAPMRQALAAATPDEPRVSLTLTMQLGAHAKSAKEYEASFLTIWRRHEDALRYTAVVGEIRERPHDEAKEGPRSRSDLFDALKEGSEAPGRTAFATFTVDIDDYVGYRATYGPQAGEACLGKVGSLLGEFGAEHGMRFYRQGLDKFLGVCMRQETPLDELARQVVDAVRGLAIPHAGAKGGLLDVIVSYELCE